MLAGASAAENEKQAVLSSVAWEASWGSGFARQGAELLEIARTAALTGATGRTRAAAYLASMALVERLASKDREPAMSRAEELVPSAGADESAEIRAAAESLQRRLGVLKERRP